MISDEYPGTTSSTSRRTVLWFYRSAEVGITSQHVINRRGRFAIADIRGPGVTRGPVSRAMLAYAILFVAEIPILLPMVAVFRSPIAFALIAAALLGPVLAAMVEHRRRPRELMLVARYRGEAVVLFQSSDEREVGKVSRALRRAFEHSGTQYRPAPPTPSVPVHEPPPASESKPVDSLAYRSVEAAWDDIEMAYDRALLALGPPPSFDTGPAADRDPP